MSFFQDLIDTGKIRTQEELRSLYRQFVKKYHPDGALGRQPADGRGKTVDFDDLKRAYRAAAARLAAQAAATPPSSKAFRYDEGSYVSELRDLLARGLPVGERAVRKNRAYASSIEYVSRSVERLYGEEYGFPQLNEQMKFLRRRLPRVYYYTLQILWSSHDCAGGYAYAEAIARRHLGFIAETLREMGFERLERFLDDVVSISVRVGAKLGLAHPGGE